MIYGGIEAGGTKMVCAISDAQGDILDRIVVKNTTPEKTLAEMATFFRNWEIVALGIACFGPIDLNKKSETYGTILGSNKKEWVGVNIVEYFKNALNIPVGLDTDVNGAVLGEAKFGCAKGCDSAIYVTVGTGVGVGVYINGNTLHGLMHPEGGHLILQRHPKDTYEGCCRFHKNCVEGLAAGPAIVGRFGKMGNELLDNPLFLEIQSYYLGQAIADYIMAYSPQKVILWGGVMENDKLFDLIREQTKQFLGGYIQKSEILEHIEDYIIKPTVGNDVGVLGAIYLAMEAERTKE